MFIGLLCTWAHRPRGGYGYTLPVPAKVVGGTEDWPIIEVRTKAGAKVRRRVSRASLRHKTHLDQWLKTEAAGGTQSGTESAAECSEAPDLGED